MKISLMLFLFVMCCGVGPEDTAGATDSRALTAPPNLPVWKGEPTCGCRYAGRISGVLSCEWVVVHTRPRDQYFCAWIYPDQPGL